MLIMHRVMCSMTATCKLGRFIDCYYTLKLFMHHTPITIITVTLPSQAKLCEQSVLYSPYSKVP